MAEPVSIHEQAAEWALRLDEGGLDLEQQVAFEAWLSADPDHAAAFRSVALLWPETDEIADFAQLIDIRADALATMRAGNARAWRNRFGARWKPLFAAAASLLLILLGSIYILHDRPITFATAIGEHRTVMLEDGSRISLDAASTVEIAYSDQRRALRLVGGRAKFDVAKDPRRPFIVSAGGRMVVATGTAFSIELVQAQMRVILYEGSVAVLDDGPSNQPPRHIALNSGKAAAADTQFRPGTQMIAPLDRPVARIEPVDLARTLSWEGGQLNFEDEPLGLAVAQINRYSEKPVRVADPATAALPISGAFNAGDTESFIDGVRSIYPIDVHVERNEIILQAKPGAL